MIDENNRIIENALINRGSGCPNPPIIDPLQVSGFVFKLAALPNISFMCTGISIPGISLDPIVQTTKFAPIPHQGTAPSFGQVTLTFKIDSEMYNWKILYDWVTLIGVAESDSDIAKWKKLIGWTEKQLPTQNKSNDYDWDGIVTDGMLTVYGKGRKPVRTITFRDMWITNLDGFQLTEEISESTNIEFTASFNYVGKYEVSDYIV